MKVQIPAIGLAVALCLSPEAAEACGGFFCGQVPVLQTAERVVFEMEGEQVTAYIQLQYQGNDPNFAWIIPVPSVPTVEVGVGSAMFDALEGQTRPIFVDAAAQAAPALDSSSCGGGFSSFSGPPAVRVRSLPVPEVNVFKEESVGPFDYVVLNAESAEDLNNWLRVNGYRVVAGSDEVVQAYLDEGIQLLALKLSPTAVASQVEPIKLTYTDDRGCASLPIKLTAIAAIPNMEIVTWIFGSGRAVSQNYGHVQVAPGSLRSAVDYVPALGAAVDAQAEGRGFVTEFAQPTVMVSDRGDPVLRDLLAKHGYVTRLRTFMDPTEMSEDPMFEVDASLPAVSNEVHLGGGFDVRTGSTMFLLALGLLWRRRRGA